MAEERKHAILFAATLLSARKIIDALDSSKPNPGKDFFIDKAIKEGGGDFGEDRSAVASALTIGVVPPTSWWGPRRSSIRLSAVSPCSMKRWSGRVDLNHRPPGREVLFLLFQLSVARP